MTPTGEKTFVATRAVKCRRPACREDAEIRGLCGCDYRVAHRLVSEELITWEELERQGKVDPIKRTAKVWFLEHAGRNASR